MSGCSYLKWRREKTEQRHELTQRPGDLLLQKDYAPEDCFGLIGKLSLLPGQEVPLLVAAFDHSSLGHELVGAREVTAADGYYGILLPPGTYDLVAFADLNGDGFFETSEAVGRTSPEAPVFVTASRSPDGAVIPGPQVAIDLTKPMATETAVRIKVNPRPYVVPSVEDPLFSPELGELGVYHPNQFLARTQRWVFAVGEPDFQKVQIVLVHGINGTPRDFHALIAGLDRARYQVWLFYYPSGLALDKVGIVLAKVVETIASESHVSSKLRLVVVAHSMGGLVGRRGVNELCRNGKPPYLKLYASFDTPYGGVESAAEAVKREVELVPSWKDVAAGSDFVTRIHEVPLPKELPFHLFFGWGKGGTHGPSTAGDGTITLASQLDPRAQAAATGMTGFADTHVGVLEDPAAIRALAELLDATAGPNAR